MYSMGYGVPQDYAQAAWLYRLAADEGYAEAQYQLGFLYADGDGVSPDYVRAHMWLNLAAAHFPASEIRKRRSAIANREAVERKMSLDQIIEAQKLAREWMTVRGIAAPLSMIDEFPHGAEFGQFEYLSSCAPCHGPTGKGDGPTAKSLNRPPTDLTKLSEANNGVFPISRAYDVIDGRSVTRAQGRRDMPVWGEIYMGQTKYPGGTLSQDSSEVIVRARILGLIEHISSLQSK
jgi:mono/diheme cytochrome c family protein